MLPLNIRSPLFVSFEVTYDCNNYCSGCINELSFSRLKKSASSRWQEIVENLGEWAALVRITGGEPLLHPDIEAILTVLQARQLPFVIFSHGRIRNIRQVLAPLQEMDCFQGFLISLHGKDARTHEEFTNVKHSYQEMREGIAAISRARLPFATTTVIRDSIIEDIEAIAELAGDLGAESIYFNRYLGIPEPKTLTHEKSLIRAIRQVEYLRKEKGMPVLIGNCIPQCLEAYEYPEFQINGFTACTVDPEGNIRAGHYPQIFGNILEQPIEAIWQGEAVQRYMEGVPEPCKRCVYAYTCPGGSRAFANKLEQRQDPQIKSPILMPLNKTIDIPSTAVPVKNKFTRVRKEAFGCIVYDLNTMYPSSASLEWVEEILNTTMKMEELAKRYGKEVLYFMAELHEAGLIYLR